MLFQLAHQRRLLLQALDALRSFMASQLDASQQDTAAMAGASQTLLGVGALAAIALGTFMPGW